MLEIRKADYDLIRWEAERSYPRECCGIILGTASGGRRTVTLTLTCDNETSGPNADRYSIHPERVVAALKLARRRSENIVGFYHSHPDQPPKYSAADLLEAHWFDCSYVITSVEKGHAAVTRSYMLAGSEEQKRFEEENIEIIAYDAALPIAN